MNTLSSPLVGALSVVLCVACGGRAATLPAAADSAATGSCHVTVTEARGWEPREIEALVEPVRPRLEACRGASGGKLRVRTERRSDGKLTFDVESGSSIDPRERKCALEALSTIAPDGASSVSSGATVRPTGFTSLLTIEW